MEVLSVRFENYVYISLALLDIKFLVECKVNCEILLF